MKAAFIANGQVGVGELADPTPGRGQALVRTHVCGLCASDQHFLSGGHNLIALSRKLGGPYAALDFARPFVPGHEYVGEVLDYGPGSRRSVRPGRRVVSVPIMRQGGSHAVVGYSHQCPGGFGELMLLDEDFLIEVPDALPDDYAALVEPLAVGLEHARRGRPDKGDAALVLGCGAIGLGVIAGLKLIGVGPIVAADFHPARRDLAIAAGAHIAIDPREGDPYAPLPAFDGRRVNLIYECVGQPGMLQRIVEAAPFDGRIVMGGYCMEAESLYVFAAQNKRLNIQFAGGEEPQDMDLALRAIADGRIDVTPWLGGRIGLGEVADAVANLSGPTAPVRTLVDPRLG
ncbi:2-desacetyl-2-hydroxyethyl bacteriochlorophyllide A dehydrogenase [Novosphingobium chloroacetimidivorans]|uniref:2-desacetyl-2-hydroxyethyl bacteriochlorophyllide A dehydrogenase n=1 Tax=Novosphingobium chloroacetimidivorans TaxID=1428314 RepID=A0A7W7NVG8_9SPHN|nr:zinc-binding dehydrogenase [Novosphingobium chloroacetimidivorans]MBB4857299.1 2-desacetyl-2-hydroxyethyl bacteriochlorophyllide A dehydrogenase [Novosphingobium chloroacetimidivorans]